MQWSLKVCKRTPRHSVKLTCKQKQTQHWISLKNPENRNYLRTKSKNIMEGVRRKDFDKKTVTMKIDPESGIIPDNPETMPEEMEEPVLSCPQCFLVCETQALIEIHLR